MVDKSGPAFPGGNIYDPHQEDVCFGAQGMSLRDWFAGQALAVLAHSDYVGEAGETSKYCYKMADAMIAERDK